MPLRLVPRRDRTVHRVFQRGEDVRLRRGQRLFEVGEPAGSVYLVREGHVRLVLPPLGEEARGKRGGRRPRKGRVGALVGLMEVFGLEALYGGTRLYSAVGSEPTVLGVASGTEFLRALRRTRWTLSELIESMQRDLQAARWGLSAHAPARARVARALLSLDGRFLRGGSSADTADGIPRRLSHSEVADVAGVHRSTVTTIVNEWIYDGVLEELRDDRLLRIRDPEALRREAFLE